MKNINKKTSAILLAILLLSIFAGCKQNTVKETTAAATAETTAAATAETTATATTETTANPDLISFPYKGPEITFKYLWADVGQGGEITDNMPIAKAIMDKIGNIKLDMELLPWTDYDTKQALYLSSGEVPDIMITRSIIKAINDYGKNGIFLDWAPLMDKYMPNLLAAKSKYVAFDILTNKNGNLYGLPIGFQDEDWDMDGWYYNKTFIDKYGIKVPTTKDELLDSLRAVKKADPKVIPFINVYKLDYTETAISMMYDHANAGVQSSSCIQWNDQTQKWEFEPTAPDSQLKPFLEFLNTLWKEKLINPEVNTATEDQIWAKMAEGMWGFTFVSFGVTNDSQKNIKKGGDVGCMLCPKGDNNTAYSPIIIPSDGVPYWGLLTGAKTKNPKILAQLINYLFSDEFTVLKNWGIEGITYTKNANGDRQYLPSIKTGLNPSGTVELSSFGFWKTPYDRTFGYSILDAEKIQQYDEVAYAAEKQNRDALDAGALLPRYAVASPSLTPDESEKVSTIMTPIETYVDESISKFIMGEKSFNEWDSFIAGIAKYGDVKVVLDIYNSKPMPKYNFKWKK